MANINVTTRVMKMEVRGRASMCVREYKHAHAMMCEYMRARMIVRRDEGMSPCMGGCRCDSFRRGYVCVG